MNELDFSSMNDAELMKLSFMLESELDAALVNMIDDGSIKKIFAKITASELEKERRGLNG